MNEKSPGLLHALCLSPHRAIRYLDDVEPGILAAAASGFSGALGNPVAFEPKAARFGDKLGPKTVDFVDVSCGQGTTCETYVLMDSLMLTQLLFLCWLE